jgi:hypothetical protein
MQMTVVQLFNLFGQSCKVFRIKLYQVVQLYHFYRDILCNFECVVKFFFPNVLAPAAGNLDLCMSHHIPFSNACLGK